MYNRKRDRHRAVKVGLLVLLCTVLYNEWFVYLIHSWQWPSTECGETKRFLKVLLVADPQLLGEQSESWIARWDNDRYLARTFAAAVRHVQPSLVIFLGDLMDEGSLATPAEYERCFLRFRNIFQLDQMMTNMTIFLPGDNDIGGEDEIITQFKTDRFKAHFGQPEVFVVENVLLFKINKLLQSYPEVKPRGDDKTQIRVALSHVPLLAMPSMFASNAIVKTQPNVIFSAHEHESVHFVGSLVSGERTLVEPLVRNTYAAGAAQWRFQGMRLTTNEIIVPTCSYRMGVQRMGYGVALFDEHGENICYGILWLPSRLVHLVVYIAIAVGLAVLAILIHCIPHCSSRSSANSVQYHRV